MPRAKINGVGINYLQAGQGPDLVMAHGLAADLSFWYLRILPGLRDRWRVTVYDQRGHGYSDAPRTGYSTRHLAGDLIGLMDHLGIERPHLVGHSFGGAVALHHAILHPDRARSLALVDSRVHALQPIPAFDDEPFWERRREKLASQGVRVPEGTPRVFYMLLEELVLLEGNGAAKKRVPPGLIPWKAGSRMDQRVKKLLLESSLAHDVRRVDGLTEEAIGGVTLPALLSYGELSQCLKTCRALEKCLPNHRTTIHPRVGHFFPTARPDLLLEDLRGFLEETESAYARRTQHG
jgi:pimeloyl-ACP methyl ester carboxylesterase